MTTGVSVLGAGSWGTTLADLLARKGHSVTLWAREPEVVASIIESSENTTFLPGVKLSENLAPTGSFEEALKGKKFVVSVIPSHVLRSAFEAATRFIADDAIIISATKGIEESTLLRPSGVIKDVLGRKNPVVALSGPSFAKEVSRRLPAAVSAASESFEAARLAQDLFSTEYFRVYTNPDVTGVELGGALKNVIALASGASDGLGLGHNARAALITRGLAEMARLGARLGADPATFSGLSGLGDLVLTCTGPLSRNYTVGLEIGKGRPVTEVLKGMKTVAEGVKTSRAAKLLSVSNKVEMPIIEAVYGVLYEGKSAKETVYDLMTRGLKGE